MKRLILFIIVIITSGPAFAECTVRGVVENAPTLCGIASQGGMLYGKVSGFDVYSVGGKSDRQKISNNDIFVIGLDRDAPDILALSFCDRKSKDLCYDYEYNIAKQNYHEQHVNVPDKFIKYPDDVQKRIDSENAEIIRARRAAADVESLEFTKFKLSSVLSKFPVSSVFGSRRVFNGIPKSPHKGIDIAAPGGTDVAPIAAGVVVIATDMYLTGKTVFITHGNGVTSAYFHLDKINAKTGDIVTVRDSVGTVGSTGRSSGAHLHLGIYWRQIALDPQIIIKSES